MFIAGVATWIIWAAVGFFIFWWFFLNHFYVNFGRFILIKARIRLTLKKINIVALSSIAEHSLVNQIWVWVSLSCCIHIVLGRRAVCIFPKTNLSFAIVYWLMGRTELPLEIYIVLTGKCIIHCVDLHAFKLLILSGFHKIFLGLISSRQSTFKPQPFVNDLSGSVKCFYFILGYLLQLRVINDPVFYRLDNTLLLAV